MQPPSLLESSAETAPTLQADIGTTDRETTNLNERSNGHRRSLGRYEIVGTLGSGAMGAVYKVLPSGGGVPLAVKVIHGLAPEASLRLKREFRCLSQIRHPNVVRTHELLQLEDALCVTMELVDGIPLTDWCLQRVNTERSVRGRGRRLGLQVNEIVRLLAQLVQGLAAIHGAGVLHRDIKPANVLVTPAGRVVILDLGLVYGDPLGLPNACSADGQLRGTPLYMAPEQGAGHRLTPAADWYSVGAMLYEVLTGKAPFHDSGLMALLKLKESTLPPLPSQVCPDIPDSLERICMRLLAIEPGARPGSEEIEAMLSERQFKSEIEAADSPEQSLIGRDALLIELAEQQTQACLGHPFVSIVEGESGIGKSTLLRSFLARLPPQFIVLWGRSSPQESIPYMTCDPIIDGLAMALRHERFASRLGEFLPDNFGALIQMFPVFRTLPGIDDRNWTLAEGLEPVAIRELAFEAFRELLTRISRVETIVLALDDAQWCDRDSAQLLFSVLSAPQAPPLHIIATFRPIADSMQWWIELVADIERAKVATAHLQLERLDEPSALRLAQRLLPHEHPNDGLAARIAQESGGNPFFIVELARGSRSSKSRATSDSPTQPRAQSPSLSFEDIVRRRTQRLQPNTRRLLQILGLGGGRLPLQLLTHMDGDGDWMAAALHELRHESLFCNTLSPETKHLELRHDRILETVTEQLIPEKVPELHRSLAQAMEKTKGAELSALGRHYRLANDQAQAKKHLSAAANEAVRMFAFERGAQLWAEVLSLDATRGEDTFRVLSNLGEVLAMAGRTKEAADTYFTAAQAAVDLDQRHRALCSSAELAIVVGDLEAGRSRLQEAFRLVDLAFPRSPIAKIWHLCLELWRARRNEGPIACEQWRSASPLESRRLQASWVAAIGLVAGVDPAFGYYHYLYYRLALQTRDPIHLGRALTIQAFLVATRRGEKSRERAHRILQRATEIAQSSGDASSAVWTAFFRAHFFGVLGDWVQGLEKVAEAIETERKFRGSSAFPCYANEICQLMFLTELGHHRQALALAHRLLDPLVGTRDQRSEMLCRYALGRNLLAFGHIEEARHELAMIKSFAVGVSEGIRPAMILSLTSRIVACSPSLDSTTHNLIHTAMNQPSSAWQSVPSGAMRRELFRASITTRLALESPSPRAPDLQQLHRHVRKLQRCPMKPAAAWAMIVRLEINALRHRWPVCQQDARTVLPRLEALGLVGQAAAVRFLLGRDLGPTLGAAYLRRADQYFTSEGISDPLLFCKMWLPAWAARNPTSAK